MGRMSIGCGQPSLGAGGGLGEWGRWFFFFFFFCARGWGPEGTGFGAFVFNGWCQKVVRKMMVFGGLAPVWGSDV